MNRYFQYENCGQVVQGFNASREIDCCEAPFYRELHPGDDEHPDSDLDDLDGESGE